MLIQVEVIVKSVAPKLAENYQTHNESPKKIMHA